MCDRITRSKYIPEAEIARFEKLERKSKRISKNNSTWRDDTLLKEYHYD